MHDDKYGRRFWSSMTLLTQTNSKEAAPGGSASGGAATRAVAMSGKLLLALLLNLAATHSALAICDITPSTINLASTKAIDGSVVPIGTIIYEETWTRTLTLTCPGNRQMYTQPVRNGTVNGIVANSVKFESEVELSNAESSTAGVSLTGDYTAYTFPVGITKSTMTVRVRYKKASNAATGPGLMRPMGGNTLNQTDLVANIWGSIPDGSTPFSLASIFLSGGTKSYSSTCNLTVPLAVAIPPAPQSQFTGIGTVPAARKDFNISAECSGIVIGQRVGVSFSESSRDASGSPGVIATSQGDGKAAGVGLQIINTTSGRPIAFGALERGTPPPTLNGTYNFPMRVQYFQTAATVTAGRVTGTTVVTMQYR